MSIQKRTIFFEKKANVPIRYSDFAMVTTTLGSMVEPFCFANRIFDYNTDYDPTDQIARVDDMTGIDLDKEQLLLSGGDHLHGGKLTMRTGR